ncbi:hypothetical protein [Pseudomonas sp. OV546]|uniref:hypothetical protein n=1 Tax=Pseudomonas sp. OV546 TaxID=1881063 RepID=UPI0008DFEBD0|nr:hypothetical protein [Pseudomonas sp. OV546]SFU90407.1 hypothetical protein SAMN05428951_10660 [Pseudomonas sp. OV546]
MDIRKYLKTITYRQSHLSIFFQKNGQGRQDLNIDRGELWCLENHVSGVNPDLACPFRSTSLLPPESVNFGTSLVGLLIPNARFSVS